MDPASLARVAKTDTCRSEGSVDHELKTLVTTPQGQTTHSPNANAYGKLVLIAAHVPLDAAAAGAFFH